MSWIHRYRVRLYLHNSVWVLPTLATLLALATVRLTARLEDALGWESNISADVARAVLTTLASSMFTFIVFLSSMMLLALQLASAQLTPRIIGVVFSDPVTKWSLTLFTFTFTFSVAAVVQTGGSIPPLTARLAAYSCMGSLAVFFYLIDHVGKALRPSNVLRSIAMHGRKVIESVYPRKLADAGSAPPEPVRIVDGQPAGIVTSDADGVLLACDIPEIVSVAERADCVLEMVPQIGDFLAAGAPLFRVFGDGAVVSADGLRGMVALGGERTIEQDPAFVFRIIVDIACKALSPAINDPTTAVLAMDQLHHLLRDVGRRCLDDDRIRDAKDRVRLVYRTPGWADYVHLAVTEIRHFGCESIQVVRRLRALLEDLLNTLPEERLPLLRQELKLLQRLATRFFPEPEDRALAEVSDSQGVGGRAEEEDGGNGGAVRGGQ